MQFRCLSKLTSEKLNSLGRAVAGRRFFMPRILRASRGACRRGTIEHHPRTSIVSGTKASWTKQYSTHKRCNSPSFPPFRALPLMRACTVAIQRPSNLPTMPVSGSGHKRPDRKDFASDPLDTWEPSSPHASIHRPGKLSPTCTSFPALLAPCPFKQTSPGASHHGAGICALQCFISKCSTVVLSFCGTCQPMIEIHSL